jgi:hypothetical protein
MYYRITKSYNNASGYAAFQISFATKEDEDGIEEDISDLLADGHEYLSEDEVKHELTVRFHDKDPYIDFDTEGLEDID